MQKFATSIYYAAWIPVIYTIRDSVGCLAYVKGASMSPTLNPPDSWIQDRVLINKRLDIKDYRRGDVIVLRSPVEPSEHLIKRIVGLPNDLLFVDEDNSVGMKKMIVVPPGRCWIEGDNEACSRDSRLFGPVPLGLVEGRVSFVIWPPSRFRNLSSM